MRSPGVEGSQRELEVCSLPSPSSALAEMPQTSCCAGDRGAYTGNMMDAGRVVEVGGWFLLIPHWSIKIPTNL